MPEKLLFSASGSRSPLNVTSSLISAEITMQGDNETLGNMLAGAMEGDDDVREILTGAVMLFLSKYPKQARQVMHTLETVLRAK